MDHWYQFWWLIFPVMGMGMGYVRLWRDHQREKQMIDLLKTYAEKGVEPPASVIEALKTPRYTYNRFEGRYERNAWPMVAFFATMATGFVIVSFVLRYQRDVDWPWILIPAGVFVALALMMAVRGLTSGRDGT
ncbi:MAG: hypothetical protein JWM33_3593 [Caulobacteraceae bacterium]|nr:hypothetical protein [Caulobacteraceae bacterium]